MARTRLVYITNRTTEPKDCMFDGCPEVVPPGYKVKIVSQPKLNAKGKPTLNITDDPIMEDVEVVVGAGPNEEPLSVPVEYAAAEAYIRQHPRMGTADPHSVDAYDTEYLLGVKAWGHDISHTEQTDNFELIDRKLLPEGRQDIQFQDVAGKRRAIDPKTVTNRKIAENKRREAMTALENPCGIKIAG